MALAGFGEIVAGEGFAAKGSLGVIAGGIGELCSGGTAHAVKKTAAANTTYVDNS